MQLIKYGVVEHRAAVSDLLNWDHLFLAGRMHKPVATLRECPVVVAAQQENKASAVRTALLLLPRRFSRQQLMETICSLSYHGTSPLLHSSPRVRLVRSWLLCCRILSM